MASTTRGEFERQRGELIKEIAEVLPCLTIAKNPLLTILTELRARSCQYQQTQSQPGGRHHSGQ